MGINDLDRDLQEEYIRNIIASSKSETDGIISLYKNISIIAEQEKRDFIKPKIVYEPPPDLKIEYKNNF